MREPANEPDKWGGTHIGGNVQVGGNFIARDLNVSGNYSHTQQAERQATRGADGASSPERRGPAVRALDGALYDVFVSHAEDDRVWAEETLLPAIGVPLERTITSQGFRPGEIIISEFERAIVSSRYTIVVLSRAYLSDPQAAFGELVASHVALSEQRAGVIPVLLEPVALPWHIDFRVRLDCTNRGDWDRELNRLRRLLNEPADS
jgi:hypothetical protein